ncbi:MAG: hypothetical protein COB66_08110 [Coxiella sp. (in: Bacteria)]|nr:MAG: hypothetical protein COB66_08110 [Coxiella sp. (in: g-proteobacteria)]
MSRDKVQRVGAGQSEAMFRLLLDASKGIAVSNVDDAAFFEAVKQLFHRVRWICEAALQVEDRERCSTGRSKYTIPKLMVTHALRTDGIFTKEELATLGVWMTDKRFVYTVTHLSYWITGNLRQLVSYEPLREMSAVDQQVIGFIGTRVPRFFNYIVEIFGQTYADKGPFGTEVLSSIGAAIRRRTAVRDFDNFKRIEFLVDFAQTYFVTMDRDTQAYSAAESGELIKAHADASKVLIAAKERVLTQEKQNRFKASQARSRREIRDYLPVIFEDLGIVQQCGEMARDYATEALMDKQSLAVELISEIVRASREAKYPAAGNATGRNGWKLPMFIYDIIFERVHGSIRSIFLDLQGDDLIDFFEIMLITLNRMAKGKFSRSVKETISDAFDGIDSDILKKLRKVLPASIYNELYFDMLSFADTGTSHRSVAGVLAARFSQHDGEGLLQEHTFQWRRDCLHIEFLQQYGSAPQEDIAEVGTIEAAYNRHCQAVSGVDSSAALAEMVVIARQRASAMKQLIATLGLDYRFKLAHFVYSHFSDSMMEPDACKRFLETEHDDLVTLIKGKLQIRKLNDRHTYDYRYAFYRVVFGKDVPDDLTKEQIAQALAPRLLSFYRVVFGEDIPDDPTEEQMAQALALHLRRLYKKHAPINKAADEYTREACRDFTASCDEQQTINAETELAFARYQRLIESARNNYERLVQASYAENNILQCETVLATGVGDAVDARSKIGAHISLMKAQWARYLCVEAEYLSACNSDDLRAILYEDELVRIEEGYEDACKQPRHVQLLWIAARERSAAKKAAPKRFGVDVGSHASASSVPSTHSRQHVEADRAIAACAVTYFDSTYAEYARTIKPSPSNLRVQTSYGVRGMRDDEQAMADTENDDRFLRVRARRFHDKEAARELRERHASRRVHNWKIARYVGLAMLGIAGLVTLGAATAATLGLIHLAWVIPTIYFAAGGSATFLSGVGVTLSASSRRQKIADGFSWIGGGIRNLIMCCMRSRVQDGAGQRPDSPLVRGGSRLKKGTPPVVVDEITVAANGDDAVAAVQDLARKQLVAALTLANDPSSVTTVNGIRRGHRASVSGSAELLAQSGIFTDPAQAEQARMDHLVVMRTWRTGLEG